jgi:hypothetical protein
MNIYDLFHIANLHTPGHSSPVCVVRNSAFGTSFQLVATNAQQQTIDENRQAAAVQRRQERTLKQRPSRPSSANGDTPSKSIFKGWTRINPPDSDTDTGDTQQPTGVCTACLYKLVCL